MDLESAKAIVLILTENFSMYPVATQRAALEGIFQLADECKEELSGSLAHDPHGESLQVSLSMAKMLLSENLKSGKLEEGFRAAAQCFWPLTEMPHGDDDLREH